MKVPNPLQNIALKNYFHFDADDSDHQVWVFLNARDDVTFPCVVTSKL